MDLQSTAQNEHRNNLEQGKAALSPDSHVLPQRLACEPVSVAHVDFQL